MFDYAIEIFVADEAAGICGHEVIQISATSVDAAKKQLLVRHPLTTFGNIYQKLDSDA